ncbi:MAG: adenylosuccinate lyase [Acidobacteria bacterium]|nr:adenylosuccinate lyase [Acidobacteriota bacterium]
MIPRYSTPEMTALWSDEIKFRKWLDVELAVCRVLARRGVIPADSLARIEERAGFDTVRIYEIEEVTHHDVVAFTTAVAEKVGEDSRYIHYGLTSTDVVDTAQALLLREAGELLATEIHRLMDTLRRQAMAYRKTPVMGRTHGIHAEPTTFGLKFALWYAEMQRNQRRLADAFAAMTVGKISGAVGTFANLEPAVEEEVCAELGIGHAAVSTQTLQRDRHAQLLSAAAICAGTYDKIAQEIRHLQRTEVREAEEPFRTGQKGSSAMPHKRNPVKCEQICGLSRVIRANALVGFENQALWHERDISHSSAERVILADSLTLLHYLSRRLNTILADLRVYPETMLQNIQRTHGLTFSGQVLLALTRKGVLRETAYAWIQRNAMKVWAEQIDFKQLIAADPDIRRHLSFTEIDQLFDLEHQLRHVETIYQRVFSSSGD